MSNVIVLQPRSTDSANSTDPVAITPELQATVIDALVELLEERNFTVERNTFEIQRIQLPTDEDATVMDLRLIFRKTGTVFPLSKEKKCGNG